MPNVNANSDGDFEFNLGNFESDWNAENALLCFCHATDFPRLPGGGFVIQALLPAAQHAAHFLEIGYERAIGLMVEHFLLPPELQEEFKRSFFPVA